MNDRIREIAREADIDWHRHWNDDGSNRLEHFARLIMQAIYEQVKEELIDDYSINIDPNPLSREYLKGCNGGVTDALILIKNFGKDIEE